jgi:arylsulfatase A-like enzyme
MSSSKPNIVFLIVDTLRQDRLGEFGYRPMVTPNLDRIARGGLCATQNFANGCVTQVAFPAMFTSTLPFDYGGYNEGINNRPVAFPEVLRDAGYETWGVVTGHPCCSFFGYGRGFDEFIDLIDLHQWFRQIFKAMLRDLLNRWKDGRLSDQEMFELLEANYGKALAVTEHFIDQLNNMGMPESGMPRDRVLRQVREEREVLKRNPRAVCEKIVDLDQQYMWVLGMERVPPRLRARLARRRKLQKAINRRLMLFTDRRVFPAPTVNDLFDAHLARRERAKPLFALVHFFDLHESKMFLSYWTADKAKRFPAALARAKAGRTGGQGGLLYDLTLNIVDAHVGRLMAILEKHGMAKDTIIVVTGDHGASAGLPRRPFVSDMSRAFYDEFLHVPFIINGPGIEPRHIDTLTNHLDLGPTILDLAGLGKPAAFQGKSLLARPAPDYEFVVSENAGNGRCDFDHKPLFFGVRGRRCKTIYETRDALVHEREVYDLIADPTEQNNLVASERFPRERARHRDYVEARLSGILRAATAAA